MRNPFGVLFERRSVGSSADLFRHLMRGYATVSGQSVSEATALNVAAVYTGVAIRSRLLATLPVDIIEKSADGRTRTPRPDHPIARVLSQPNKGTLNQTWPEFAAMLETHRLLRGNGYAWINRVVDPSRPVGDPGRIRVAELLPLHPDKVDVLVPDGRDDFGATAYRYTTRSGQPLNFTASEILHLKGMTTDGRQGRSFLHDMREVIGGALATQEHSNSLWSRDATPSVTLSHPKNLSDTARKNLEESWEQTYGRGADKKRVAVLEEGLTVAQLSLSPEDGQFLQTKQDLRQEIAAALMVPPHMMGLSDKATSWGSGIAEQNIGLLTYTLGPDVRIWETRLGMDLLTAPEKYQIKFNVRALMRGNFADQITTLVRGIQGGIWSVNDALAWLDMNPIEGGDTHLQPVNYAPLGFDPSLKPTGAGA